MRGRSQPSAAASAGRIVSLVLALGATLLALLAVPVAGAASSRSFALRIAAQTPSVTINNAEPLSANNDRYIAIDSSATLNRDHFMPMTCGNVVVSAPS